MRFYDFDIGLSPGHFPDTRDVNLRYRAFVDAVFSELAELNVDAPWRKFYVVLASPGTAPEFQAAIPSVGLSAAGITIGLPNPELLTAEGEAVRRLLADAVTGTREHVRDKANWDDASFWDSIKRVGAHRGSYERRLLPVIDRKSKLLYHLTYEWDEAGTTVFADLRHAMNDPERLARTVVEEFPGQWEIEWIAGFAPRRVRLTPDRLEVYDRNGTLLADPLRPG